MNMEEFSTPLQQRKCRISGGIHFPEEFNNISCSQCLFNRFLVNPIKYQYYINNPYDFKEVIYVPIFSNENSNFSWEIHIPDPENEQSRTCEEFFGGDEIECDLWKKCCYKARECCEQQQSYQESTKNFGISNISRKDYRKKFGLFHFDLVEVERVDFYLVHLIRPSSSWRIH